MWNSCSDDSGYPPLWPRIAVCGGGYWMVTDPVSKNLYYTEEVKQSKSGVGAVKFIDAKTGSEVNLQNSELKEITKDEFKAGVGKK